MKLHRDLTEFLVVGGGIGGLTTALALARSGRRARVFERAPEFSEVGAGIQLAPNATRLLHRLGVLERVIDAGLIPARLVLADATNGDELCSLDIGEAFRQRFGGPYLVVHRTDLLAIFLEACREQGVALETNRPVERAETSDDRATAYCSDGSVYEGCALIGADGLRSDVRRRFSDDEPICSGYVAYRGTVPMEEIRHHHGLDTVIAWLGPGLHLVQYPIRRGEMYNQVAVFRSDRYAAGEEDWGTPEELEQRFSAMCAPVRDALPSLWRNVRWPMYDREAIDTWTTGRIALLGDAAHPVLQYLAQGACQAIEDAVTLVEALDRARGEPAADGGGNDVARAFTAYQRARLPRTSRVQRSARTWGDIWHLHGAAALVRNELLRQRTPDDHSHIDWLFDWQPPNPK
ncbi:FAD-dependent monooxygenase [Micromonospora sp. NPDC047707]|uniref:FAD-dependent monooxygenase n=1 Tax=Micromonospora sp. NPDC047707 TaxID=3154498 RepID=UPI0034532E4D